MCGMFFLHRLPGLLMYVFGHDESLAVMQSSDRAGANDDDSSASKRIICSCLIACALLFVHQSMGKPPFSFHRDRNRTSTDPGRRCKKNVPHTQRPPVFDDECSWNQQNQTSEEGSCSWLLLSSVYSFYHQPGLRAWC